MEPLDAILYFQSIWLGIALGICYTYIQHISHISHGKKLQHEVPLWKWVLNCLCIIGIMKIRTKYNFHRYVHGAETFYPCLHSASQSANLDLHNLIRASESGKT